MIMNKGKIYHKSTFKCWDTR